MAWSDKAKTGESGLADEYKLTVRSAKFAFPYENAPDACALVLEGERRIGDSVDDGHLWLGCGDFEPGDKAGSFAIHSTQDESRHFNQNSKLGKFLKSAGEVGLMDVLESRQAADRQQYEEKDAQIWVGLTLDIEEVTTTGKLRSGPDAGKEFTSRQPLIRAFQVAGEAPAAAPAAASNGSGEFDEAKAIALVGEHGTFMEYYEAMIAAGGDENAPYAKKAFYAEHSS